MVDCRTLSTQLSHPPPPPPPPRPSIQDFLTVLTSCIVCVLKSDPSLVEHTISWGFAHSLVALLRAALDHHRRGEPVTCVMRLLHQLADRPEAVEHLAHAPTDAVAQVRPPHAHAAPCTAAHVTPPPWALRRSRGP